MGNLTREQIFARKIGKGVATLPDGSTVAIRALTRDEVLQGQQKYGDDIAMRENYFISCAMTDPKMSEEDVAAWAAEADAGDLTSISDQIAELSGLTPGAGKVAYKSPRG